MDSYSLIPEEEPMQKNPIHMSPRPSKHKPDEIRTYKKVADRSLKAHLFFPKDRSASGGSPAFVFFHPGGWQMGEPEWGYDLCHRYASSGVIAISFQYRLSSIGGYSPAEAVSDAKSAVRWTREVAAELDMDSTRVVAGGISAGGHLAACAAVLPEPDDTGPSCVPDALALQSTPVNPVIDNHFVELLQGRDSPEKFSPAHHVRPGLPPMCLIHGTADEIVPHDSVKDFVTRMREAGNRCELHSFEGTDHFFMKNPNPARVTELMDDFFSGLGYMEKSKKG